MDSEGTFQGAAQEVETGIEGLLAGENGDPFRLLGPHVITQNGQTGIVVRAFLPQAKEALVESADGTDVARRMEQTHAPGFFEVFYPGRESLDYQIRVIPWKGSEHLIEDPYRFPPLLSEFDLYLIGEGNHQELYDKMGAHLWEVDGVAGVLFAVWAPNATSVNVVGDFNAWDNRRHPMRFRGGPGVWELFLPDVGEYSVYKYEVHSNHGPFASQQKADPCGFYAEMRPNSGSVVFNLDRYQWNDKLWMDRRAARNHLEEPVSIYEVHLGSWKQRNDDGNRFLTYRELADELIPYVKNLGFSHIELLPITEHPFDASWGYQTLGYFAPTSRFGTPEDFMYFIDQCHQEQIGVILDWVPGHFPKDAHGLLRFDGTALYEHADPRQGVHPDWDTLIFNYGRNEVRGFLLSNALFWLRKYHVDGLRVDAVASMLYLDYSRQPGEWIPNRYGGNENLEAVEFLKKFNELAHSEGGAFTAAEESTQWSGVSRPVYLGGLGFTFKWNMGWMHDILEYMEQDPIHRKYHHNNLTFVLLYAFHENFILALSHDEVVHGKSALLSKMPGDYREKFANLRLLYGYMYAMPGKKLLFMGDEFGQWNEWNHENSLDWMLLDYDSHRNLQRFVQDLNRLYRSEPALYEVDFHHEGFEWIDFHDYERSLICFLRRAKNTDDHLVIVCNFTPVARENYRVGVPDGGFYRELLNSDAEVYGGENHGNAGGAKAEPVACHDRPYSLNLTLPPLAVIVLKKD